MEPIRRKLMRPLGTFKMTENISLQLRVSGCRFAKLILLISPFLIIWRETLGLLLSFYGQFAFPGICLSGFPTACGFSADNEIATEKAE